MVVVFSAAVFLSATLLFLVQPIVARLVLPLLGGTPAVWNTCVLFFQSLLLVGYAYSHFLTKVRSGRAQVIVHSVVGLAMLATLPIGLPFVREVPPGEPIRWLLWTLVVAVGVPFALLAATGPLLQRWFSRTDHPSAHDPYFLYAASNAGSLLALFGYPVLVEPLVPLGKQTGLWSGAVVVLVGLIVLSGVLHLRRRAGAARAPNVPRRPAGESKIAPLQPGVSGGWGSARRVLLWVLLSAAPSSLMLGATTFISTDLAAVPLLWIGPLAVYLVTMIVAFSRWGPRATRFASAALPLLAIGLVVSVLMSALRPIEVLVGLHLLVLLFAAMSCHGRLGAMRPDASQLTGYFLWISVGGALGGLFNAVVAPMLFTRIAEYPIALVLSCALGMGVGQGVNSAGKEIASAIDDTVPSVRRRRTIGAMSGVAGTIGFPVAVTGLLALCIRFPTYFIFNATWKANAISYAVPALACFLLIRWPLRFSIALAGFFVVAAQGYNSDGTLVYNQRGFFGVARVIERTRSIPKPKRVEPTAGSPAESPSASTPGSSSNIPGGTTGDTKVPDARVSEPRRGITHQLMHGNTAHGLQFMDPLSQDIPRSYYHPTGPAGLVFLNMTKAGRLHHAGLVGLGTGALAAYGRPQTRFTFFEVDPGIVALAKNPVLFTYLQRSQAEVEIRIGDGRRLLTQHTGPAFDLIVLDAFSSDSIPIHLLTTEAVRMYIERLAERGVVLVHLSNRHLKLQLIVRGIAKELGLAARENLDEPPPLKVQEWSEDGKFPSYWVLLARSEADFDFLGPDARWLKFMSPKEPDPVWTDDYSNILEVLHLGS